MYGKVLEYGAPSPPIFTSTGELKVEISSTVADLSPGMHGLLPDRQNREIIVFIMNHELL